MGTIVTGMKRFYGAHPLHLLASLACFALVGYVIALIGPKALWNPDVWWQSILVWFLGAIIAHDLLLFPLYALADRSLSAGLRAVGGRRSTRRPEVPALNYIRVPFLGSGLLLLLFFPGIIQQGQATYLAATGQTQQPYFGRWLLLTAVLFGLSAVVYATRLGISAKRSPGKTRKTTEAGPRADRERSA
ncbi:hypothetical protein ACFWPH_33335 [Nocardia sp. NPDC058499]|uniref:hypothetical protein n=1 Tax=Nocardia sp. NPDC058499 TaxID=3346530 RepID=UPI003663C5D6